VGVPIQKENEVPLGPEARREENREEMSPYSFHSGVWESVRSSPSWAKMVLMYFVLRRSLLLTAGDRKFFTFLS